MLDWLTLLLAAHIFDHFRKLSFPNQSKGVPSWQQMSAASIVAVFAGLGIFGVLFAWLLIILSNRHPGKMNGPRNEDIALALVGSACVSITFLCIVFL